MQKYGVRCICVYVIFFFYFGCPTGQINLLGIRFFLSHKKCKYVLNAKSYRLQAFLQNCVSAGVQLCVIFYYYRLGETKTGPPWHRVGGKGDFFIGIIRMSINVVHVCRVSNFLNKYANEKCTFQCSANNGIKDNFVIRRHRYRTSSSGLDL